MVELIVKENECAHMVAPVKAAIFREFHVWLFGDAKIIIELQICRIFRLVFEITENEINLNLLKSKFCSRAFIESLRL